MILLLNNNEETLGSFDNDAPKACPYYDDIMKPQLGTAYISYKFTVPLDHESGTPGLIADDEDFYVVRNDHRGNLLQYRVSHFEDDHDFGKTRTVYCELVSMELNGKQVRPTTWTGVNGRQALTNVLTGTRWVVGEADWTGTATFEIKGYKTVLSMIHEIAETLDAELVFRVEMQNNRVVKRIVDLVQRRGQAIGERFDIDQNIQGIKKTVDRRPVVTALIGLGKGDENGERITFADREWIGPEDGGTHPVTKPLGQDWVGDPEALEQSGILYNGEKIHIEGQFESETQDGGVLLWETWRELQKRKVGLRTYEVEAQLLTKKIGVSIEDINIGDVVIVSDTDIEPPILLEARVIEMEISFSDESKNMVKLGNYKPLFTNTNKIIRQIQTKLIQNEGLWSQSGENVIKGPSAPENPEPNQLWIDTLDPNLNVWKRWDDANQMWVKVTVTNPTDIGAETPEGAQTKANTAKTEAITTAGQDATNKANQAETNAKEHADQQVATREKAIHFGTTPPTDTTRLWSDRSSTPEILRRYNNGSWVALGPTNPEDIGAVAKSLYDIDVPALQGRMDTAEQDILDRVLQVDFNNLSGRVSQTEVDIQTNADSIATKVSQTTYEADINDATTGLKVRVMDAESTIEQHATEISSKVAQTTYEADITNATTGLKPRMSSAESTIDQHANLIASKVSQTDFNSLEGRMDTAESTIVQQADEISQRVTKTEFEKLQISGRNVASIHNWLAWDNTTLVRDGYKLTLTGDPLKNGSNGINTKAFMLNIEPNKQYILSFKIKRIEGVLKRIGGHIDPIFSNKVYFKIDGVDYPNATFDTPPILSTLDDGGWHDVEYSFLTPGTITDERIYIQANRGSYTSPIKVELIDLQMEQGTKKTGWSPSPEDTKGEINGLDTRVSDAESTIVQHADLIASKVSQTDFNAVEGRLDTAESNITQNANAITQRVTTTTYNSGMASKENTVFKQTSAPAHSADRLWLNTGVTPNVLYRSTGSAWVKVTPTTASEVGAYSQTAGSSLAGRVSTAESTIEQHADEIALRVTKDGVISSINQTAETIKINASKLDLVGYATFTSLSTSGSTTINADNLTTGKITAVDIEGVNITGANFKSAYSTTDGYYGEMSLEYDSLKYDWGYTDENMEDYGTYNKTVVYDDIGIRYDFSQGGIGGCSYSLDSNGIRWDGQGGNYHRNFSIDVVGSTNQDVTFTSTMGDMIFNPSSNVSVNGDIISSGDISGELVHTTGYFVVHPYGPTYDDGTYFRAYWDGPNRNFVITARDDTTSLNAGIQFGGRLTNTGTYNVTAGVSSNVYVNSSGQFGRATSSIKYKKDVEALWKTEYEKVLNLHPVWYKVKNVDLANREDWSYVGLIAEEVHEIEPRLVHYKNQFKEIVDEKGNTIQVPLEHRELEPEGVQYERLAVYLLPIIKEQQTRIEELENRLAILGV